MRGDDLRFFGLVGAIRTVAEEKTITPFRVQSQAGNNTLAFRFRIFSQTGSKAQSSILVILNTSDCRADRFEDFYF